MKLPAGVYYIGDPCYVIADEKWDAFWPLSFSDHPDCHESCAVTEFEGHPLYAHGTAYGDGVYLGSDGVEYAVDAGMIGIIPEALIAEESRGDIARLGSLVTFHEPFNAYRDDNFTFHFGNIDIPTESYDIEDEEESEEEWP